MNWQADITKTREAHLRAVLAEYARDWHLVIRDYLYCLEAAERAGDVRAVGFFAAKLAAAYRAIGLGEKAQRYGELAAAAQNKAARK